MNYVKQHLFISLLMLVPNLLLAQNITTVMGSGSSAYTGDYGQAINAGLGSLGLFTFDYAGNCYVTEYNHTIRKISFTGIINTVAGNGIVGYNGDNIIATSAKLNSPFGVAIDHSGNIYISDNLNNRIRKVNGATGIITTIAGTGVAGYNGDNLPAISAQIYGPVGIVFDTIGNLYFSDAMNRRIRKIDTSGIIITIAGNGNIGNGGDGGLATSAELYGSGGIHLDMFGNMYITSANKIRKISLNTGIITTVAGVDTFGYNGDNILATTAWLWFPQDVIADNKGNIYITDDYNNRVRKVDSSGIITTVIGTGILGYGGDNGPATLADISSPRGVALDKCGNLYFTDNGNHRIRKVWFNTDTIPQVNIAVTPNDTVSTGTQVTTTATVNIGTIVSCQWIKNGVATSTTTNSYTYTPTNGDSIYCIVTTRACTGRTYTDTTLVLHITVTGDAGIASTKNYRTHTYPNPVTDVLHVATTEPLHYVLHNLMGVAIIQGTVDKKNGIDTKAIPSGIYLLQLTNAEGQREVVRVVKE